MVSIGPTTSMRMERYEKEFLEKTGVKLVIGKGGMGAKTAEGCKESTAVHAVFPGGCGLVLVMANLGCSFWLNIWLAIRAPLRTCEKILALFFMCSLRRL